MNFLLRVLILSATGVIYLNVATAQSVDNNRFSERFVERFKNNDIGIDNFQIWSIAEGVSGFIFAATNEGLVLFDGVRWRVCSTSNDQIIRSLYFDKISGRLYSAGVNNFGFWMMNHFGDMEYTSLFSNHNVKEQSIDFWRIVPRANSKTIYFQTHTGIYSYDPATNSSSLMQLPQGVVGYSFAVMNDVYIQIGQKLYTLNANHTLMPVCDIQSRVVAMIGDGFETLVAIERHGIFKLSAGKLTSVSNTLNAMLSGAKINCFMSYLDGYLVGTTKGGLFVLDANWQAVRTNYTVDDLNTQTILSIYVDSRSDIWLGFNSGLAKIDISSNEKYVYSRELGQVESIQVAADKVLVATNKGLFEIREPDNRVVQVEGSSGATWKITKLGESVFVLSDRGMFEYTSTGLKQVHNKGVIDLSRMELQSEYCIVSNYVGISLYHYKDSQLSFVTDIEGYNTYPNGLTIDRYDNIWLSVPGIGFQRIKLSSEGTKVAQIRDYNIDFDAKSFSKSIFTTTINGEFILYANNRAYSYDVTTDSININEPVTNLLNICGRNLVCIEQFGNKIWYQTRDDIGYLELLSGSAVKHSNIFGQNRTSRVTPKFFSISDNTAVGFNNSIGFTKGKKAQPERIVIGKAEAVGTSRQITYDRREKVFEVPFSMNNLKIYPVSIPRGSMVDYRVSSTGNEWTTIKLQDCILISALSATTHTIEIRPSGVTDRQSYASMVVSIAPPWYISRVAILVYFLLFITIILLLRAYYRRSNRIQQQQLTAKQNEALERETLRRDKQIAELQKEQIKMELRQKDKKLANITMNGIKINNILNELKVDIVDIQTSESQSVIRQKVQKVVRKINTQLSNEDDWKRSESYFNAIYDGLLDRLRTRYPSLTKTDLKLCVYIKLNHTTKEIAELMNISPRSIEMARYRLKKKLGLSATDTIEQILK